MSLVPENMETNRLSCMPQTIASRPNAYKIGILKCQIYMKGVFEWRSLEFPQLLPRTRVKLVDRGRMAGPGTGAKLASKQGTARRQAPTQDLNSH